MEDCNTCGKPNCKMGYPTPIGFKLFCSTKCANYYMNYPSDYPLELDSPEHYVFESEDLEESDIIPIGSTIRSYDFIIGKEILRDDFYFEGVIEKFEPVPTCSPDCNHYIVRTTKIVRNGEEEDIIEGSNDYFSTHWNNYGVIPLVEPVDYEDSGDEPEYNWEYDDFDAETYTPPAAAIKAAKKGLSQRKKWGRGGLSPAEAKSQGIDSGVTRARKIASGKVSRHDVRRMSAFNRHRKNNKPSKKMPDGGPTAGTIAWNLWGGSAGVNWAKKKSATMNAETIDYTQENCHVCGTHEDYESMTFCVLCKKMFCRKRCWGSCKCGSCRAYICEECDEEGCPPKPRPRPRVPHYYWGAEEMSYSPDRLELAGYVTANGASTKIAISKEALKHYTKQEIVDFIQSEINESSKYMKSWYFAYFSKCFNCGKIMNDCMDEDGNSCGGKQNLRVKWVDL